MEQKENQSRDFRNLIKEDFSGKVPQVRARPLGANLGVRTFPAQEASVAASPRSEFDLSSQMSLETPVTVKIAELVRLQKSAQRITSTLNLDEIIDRVVDEVSISLGCVEINLYLHEREQNELVLMGVRGCKVQIGRAHV